PVVLSDNASAFHSSICRCAQPSSGPTAAPKASAFLSFRPCTGIESSRFAAYELPRAGQIQLRKTRYFHRGAREFTDSIFVSALMLLLCGAKSRLFSTQSLLQLAAMTTDLRQTWDDLAPHWDDWGPPLRPAL